MLIVLILFHGKYFEVLNLNGGTLKWSHDYIKEMFYIPIKLKPELARASMTYE
jgi:hypothetical protein